MKTIITFKTSDLKYFEAHLDGGKIKAIKALRKAFATGLQESKRIVDQLWTVQTMQIDLMRAQREGLAELRTYGIHISQPAKAIPIDVRVLQLVKAALKADEPLLAADLLQAYNMHKIREEASEGID